MGRLENRSSIESGCEEPREVAGGLDGPARLPGTWQGGIGDGSFHFYVRGGLSKQGTRWRPDILTLN